MFVACQKAGASMMEVAWKSVLEWCAGCASITHPPHRPPHCGGGPEQGDSCEAFSSLLESLMNPWRAVAD